MYTQRIIPCLDVKEGQVVKGIQFKGLQEVGDPVQLAKKYAQQGADELVFLDISATLEGRKTMIEVVRKVAKEIFIPFTVGGGIRSLDDISALLRAGADKVSLNSAAILDPSLITKASNKFGAQCIVVAIDGKKREDDTGWNVYTHGGTKDTGIDLEYWCKKAVELGAGEILLTSMDADGGQKGYDLALCKTVKEIVPVPVIASGGCGCLEDFYTVFSTHSADAALAASLFHYDQLSIEEVKDYLQKKGVSVRYDPAGF